MKSGTVEQLPSVESCIRHPSVADRWGRGRVGVGEGFEIIRISPIRYETKPYRGQTLVARPKPRLG
jgi:hypothetical protein